MEKVTDILSEEHKVVMGVLTKFEAALRKFDIETIKDTITFFNDKLVLHRRKEEEILFPELKPIVGEESGPVACMLEEHKIEKELLEKLSRNIGEAKSSKRAKEAVVKAGFEIIDLLTKHIWKEDNVLFPMAESVLPAEAKEKVANGFGAIGACCCECVGHK